MICPYNRKSETQVLTWNQNPSEENETVMKNGGQMMKTTFELMDCERENCGAWADGRCRYSER